jgi:hypothetical protein
LQKTCEQLIKKHKHISELLNKLTHKAGEHPVWQGCREAEAEEAVAEDLGEVEVVAGKLLAPDRIFIWGRSPLDQRLGKDFLNQ